MRETAEEKLFLRYHAVSCSVYGTTQCAAAAEFFHAVQACYWCSTAVQNTQNLEKNFEIDYVYNRFSFDFKFI